MASATAAGMRPSSGDLDTPDALTAAPQESKCPRRGLPTSPTPPLRQTALAAHRASRASIFSTFAPTFPVSVPLRIVADFARQAAELAQHRLRRT
jgi:hypothetical protein